MAQPIPYHLRKNAKFHDGKPVTAQDIKWSLERATDPATEAPTVDVFLGDILGTKAKLKGEAAEIAGVRVIDEHTVSMHLGRPQGLLPGQAHLPHRLRTGPEQRRGQSLLVHGAQRHGAFPSYRIYPGGAHEVGEE